jgi:hypothetical protein
MRNSLSYFATATIAAAFASACIIAAPAEAEVDLAPTEDASSAIDEDTNALTAPPSGNTQAASCGTTCVKISTTTNWVGRCCMITKDGVTQSGHYVQGANWATFRCAVSACD